jgi:UDP-N-acetylglucosamine--N-acetylmuramyl-(pentapeptide) pyrophosphoryl-undecaprenol N-acetylglucosamine transferase
MRILIAAGGTGGHIYPALAVLRALAERELGADVRWVGGRRGLESAIVPASGHRLERLWLRSLRSVDVSLHSVLDPLRLLASVPQAVVSLSRRRPDVIFTTGGYVAIPVLVAAAALRIPSLLWEGNRIAGRSVRATARLATVRAVTFSGTLAHLPAPAFTTGTPIRDFPALSRHEARASLGLPTDRDVLLVFGGSQAVRRLNEAVSGALPALLEHWTVIHLTGADGLVRAQAERDQLPADLRERYRPFSSLADEMGPALLAADAVVGRAGSSTLAEATALGLPLVVVPYPHAAAHQAANAREVAEAAAGELIRDEDFDAAALTAAAARLADPARRAKAAQASRALGRPGAARAAAELLAALADRGPLPAPDRIEALSRGAP